MNLYKHTKLLTNLTLSLTLAALIPVSTVYANSNVSETSTATLIASNSEIIREDLIAEAEKAKEKKAAAEKAEREAREAAEKAALEAQIAAAEAIALESAVSSVSTPAASYEAPAYTEAPSGDPLTPSKGVVYYNGHRETYYSQNVLPGTGLDIPGRHVAEDGTVRDADNYICVASSDLSKGTVVETSLGTAKVYDSGCASGTVDIYTNW